MSLQELVQQLATARRKAALAQAHAESLRAAFDEHHARELREVQEAFALVVGLDGKLREAARVEFRASGDKAPALGVTIAVQKRVEYEEQRVFGWALKRQVCLALDAKAFEALAKKRIPLDDQGQPLATVYEEPVARISSDLDQVLAGGTLTVPAQPGAAATAARSWTVPSTSTPGVEYTVTEAEDGTRTCSCPGFVGHGHCKHLASTSGVSA